MMFSERDFSLIEQFAESMTKQEACDWYGINYTDLDEQDQINFDKAYLKGRTNIKYFAMNKLKEACSGKQGMQASLAILSRFGEEWASAEQMADVKKFTVMLDG